LLRTFETEHGDMFTDKRKRNAGNQALLVVCSSLQFSEHCERSTNKSIVQAYYAVSLLIAKCVRCYNYCPRTTVQL